ncbi:MAG: hypothetical protein ACRDX8_12810, partial [Acidimicrobiales bacterium]
TCAGAGIMPITWEGAGGMAAALLRSHQVPRPDHERLAAVEADARKAYYGGHFEVSRRGALEQVHAYDINSAYPAIYADLPCLDHGRWELVNDGDQAPADGEAMFTYLIYDQPDTPWPVFPFRISAGNIANRRQGRGWHPSCLVDLAANDPTTMLFPIRTWYYTRECNCRHFDWVGELFVERQRLGKALKGYPIKLGLNSLYGKFAQSVGHPTHATPIWATLITGWVRVQVDRVAQRHPDTCAMIATDAVYLVGDTAPELDCGAALGQWSHARYDDMVVCQPGYYWTRDGDATVSSHTRGVSKAADVDWATILDRATSLDVPLKVTMTRYHGWREAWHRGKPDLAGIWDDGTSDLVWGGPKRRWEGQVGLSHIGDMREESIPHKGLMGGDALHVEAAFGELWDDDLGLQFG